MPFWGSLSHSGPQDSRASCKGTDIQINFLQRDGHTNQLRMDIQTRRNGHTNQLLVKGWTYKSASCRDGHTNQKGWTYKSTSSNGMDIQTSILQRDGHIFFEIWQGRACELSTLALDVCIISLLSIMSHCVRAFSYVSMHGSGECTQSKRNKLCDKVIGNLPRRQPSLYWSTPLSDHEHHEHEREMACDQLGRTKLYMTALKTNWEL
jgi:hypothetical protein